MTFLAFALENSSCFYSLEDYYERDQSKYILMELRKFETSAGKLLSSTSDKKQIGSPGAQWVNFWFFVFYVCYNSFMIVQSS